MLVVVQLVRVLALRARSCTRLCQRGLRAKGRVVLVEVAPPEVQARVNYCQRQRRHGNLASLEAFAWASCVWCNT